MNSVETPKLFFSLLNKQSALLAVATLLVLFLLAGPTFGFVLLHSVARSGPEGPEAVNSLPLSSTTTKSLPEAGYEVSSATPGTIVKVQSNWVIPFVTCTSATSGAFMQFIVAANHLSFGDASSGLEVTCAGTVPTYSLNYELGGPNIAVPSYDLFTPGDLMRTIASISILGGEVSIEIDDITEGWVYQNSGVEPIVTTSSVSVAVIFSQPGGGTSTSPLINFGSIPTTADSATLNGHTGSLGSFLPLTKFTVTKLLFVDHSNSHVVAKPTSITFTSTRFTINYVQGS